jgi:peptidoglycan/LPS O-acetylase OafA/YrhL
VDRYLSKKLSLLRFLAVASVIVYHAYPFAPGEYVLAPPAAGSAAEFAQGYISLALMRWALPFLGLVSGYLFFRTLTPTAAGFARKMRRRVRTLLVPFLIWSGLGVLFCVVVAHSPYADVSPYWTVNSLGEALDRWLLHPVIYPLWFLQALMVCVILSPLIYLLIRVLKGWTLLLAAVWWATGWQPEALQPWLSVTAFTTFTAGAVIAQRGWRWPFRAGRSPLPAGRSPLPAGSSPLPAGRSGAPPAWAAATFVATWLAASALYTLYGHALGAWTRTALLGVVVLGFLALWTACDALRRPLRASPALVAALLYVAPLSFFVYVTQEPPLSVLQDLLERAAPGLPAILAYALPPLLVIALAVLVGLALRRVAPRAFAAASGGRVPGAAPLLAGAALPAGDHEDLPPRPTEPVTESAADANPS